MVCPCWVDGVTAPIETKDKGQTKDKGERGQDETGAAEPVSREEREARTIAYRWHKRFREDRPIVLPQQMSEHAAYLRLEYVGALHEQCGQLLTWVTMLKIIHLNLAKPLPASLALMTQLEEVIIVDGFGKGRLALPGVFGEMEALTTLELRRVPVAVEDCSGWHLRSLTLDDCVPALPDGILTLPALKYLTTGNTPLKGVSRLASLEIIHTYSLPVPSPAFEWRRHPEWDLRWPCADVEFMLWKEDGQWREDGHDAPLYELTLLPTLRYVNTRGPVFYPYFSHGRPSFYEEWPDVRKVVVARHEARVSARVLSEITLPRAPRASHEASPHTKPTPLRLPRELIANIVSFL